MSLEFSLFEKIVRAAKHIGVPAPTEEGAAVHPFDERNIHPSIAKVSQKLFDNGHYPQATFEAFKYIDNQVKKVSGIQETGFKLMMQAFDENKPKIQLNDMSSMSDKDEQLGFRHMFAGSASGIRNPRGHDNDDDRPDTIDLCLDHLSVASVLLRTLENRKLPPP
jgi:uncharacterized protein (TIGR02391 family)